MAAPPLVVCWSPVVQRHQGLAPILGAEIETFTAGGSDATAVPEAIEQGAAYRMAARHRRLLAGYPGELAPVRRALRVAP